MQFVRCSNNGVIALLTVEDYRNQAAGRPLETGYFLFVPDDYLVMNHEPWFHGSYSLMEELTKSHTIEFAHFGVPFSNGAQLYGDRKTLLSEIESIAPMWAVLREFDVELKTVEPWLA